MKTTINVFNAAQQIAHYQVTTGETLIIQAHPHANYQLIDEASGFAPQNIIAKREQNNLIITLEDGDMTPDIIIENYYPDHGVASNILIGQHESGNLYAYVPESGELHEAVSLLAEEIAAPQALGGEVLREAAWISPWWLLSTLPLLGSLYAFKDKRLAISEAGEIDTEATPDRLNKQVNLSGQSKGLAQGTTVNLTLIDQHGTTINVQATVGADGQYHAPQVNTAALFDGPVTVLSHAKDKHGLPVQDRDIIQLDQRIPGDADHDHDTETEEAGKPHVTLLDGQDGRIHVPDLNEEQLAQAHITFPAERGYTVGDMLVVTDHHGKVLLERPLTTTDLTDGVRLHFTPQMEEGADNALTAVVTDPQGNRSIGGNAHAMTDLRIPGDSNQDTHSNTQDAFNGAPQVTIATGKHGHITSPTLDGEQAVATIHFAENHGYSVGDILRVTLPQGNETQSITLTAQHFAEGVRILFNPAEEGAMNTVTATVTDPQGNRSAEGSASARSDLRMPGDSNRDTDISNSDAFNGAPQVTIATGKHGHITSPTLDGEQAVATIHFAENHGYSVGDILRVTLPQGNEAQSITLTAQHFAEGVRVLFNPAEEGEMNTVTATVTDPQGNRSAEGSASARSDLRMPGDSNRDTDISNNDAFNGAPQVTIATGKHGHITSPTLDGEQAVATIHFAENHGYSVGDILRVTLPQGNEAQSIALTAQHFAEGVRILFNPAEEGAMNTVTATVTDPQGNRSAEGSASARSDLRMPGDSNRDTDISNSDAFNGAPQVTISTGKHGHITSPTLDGEQAVATIHFAENHGYSVGDILRITLPQGNETQSIALTAQHFAEGVRILFNPAEEGAMNTVTATVTDPQGNRSAEGSASARSDLRMPGDSNRDTDISNSDAFNGAPQVTISTGKHGHITSPTLDGEQAVATIHFAENHGYSVGDILRVTLPQGNEAQSITLTAQHFAEGVRILFNPAEEGAVNTVTATVTDPQGNRSAEGSASARSDLRMPGDSNRDTDISNSDAFNGAPQVTISTGKHGHITSPTLDGEQAVATIHFAENHGYSVGDILRVTLPQGNEAQSITLTAAHFTDGVRVLFHPAEEGAMNTVTATVTDPQGNRSAEGSARARSDLRMPGDSNRDTDISNSDAFNGAPQVTIATGKHGHITSPTLDGEQAVATIHFAENHGYSVGDILRVTLPQGNEAQSITLTAQHFAEGVRILFHPAEEGAMNTVTATVTDPQGNRSAEGSASARSDLRMPGDSNRDTDISNSDAFNGAPQVTISTGKHGHITSPTLDGEQAVATIHFAENHGYSVGDILRVTLPQGNEAQSITLTAAHFTDGVRVLFNPAEEGAMNTVTATVTDPQGNRSAEGSARARSDLRMPGDSNRDTDISNSDAFNGAPQVTIATGKHGHITSPTLDGEQAVATIHFAENHGYSVGDILRVTLPQGNEAQSITLTAQHFAEGVRILFHPAEEGAVNTVTATVTDPQGNRSAEGSASARSDLRMPGDSNRDTDISNSDAFNGAPQVTISTGKHGHITSPTLDGEQAVATIHFAENHGYSVGDILRVTLPQGNEAQSITLTAAHFTDGVRVLFHPAEEGAMNTVTATVTDPQGNRSAEGSASARSDLRMPGDSNVDTTISEDDENLGAPEVILLTGKNERITSPTLEGGKAVAIIGVFEELGYSVGDRLEVTLPGNNPPQTIILTEHDFAEGVKVLFDPAAEGQENIVSAFVTDPQGNRSAQGSGRAISDLIMPGDTNRDTETNHSDFHDGAPEVIIQPGNRSALIHLSPANGYSVDDRLDITLPDQSTQHITLESAHLTGGVLVSFEPLAEGQTNTVTAVVTDPQGNRSAEGRDSSVNRGTPVVHISTGNNSALNSPDLVNEKGVATISVPEANGFKVGDTLLVTLPQGNAPQTISLTEQHLRDGVRVSFTPVAEGEFNVVRAVVTDPQGNRSAEGSDRALSDLRMPGDTNRDTQASLPDVNNGAPQVMITTGKNGRVTSPTLENGQAVATIKLSANDGYSVGDNLVVTLPSGNTTQTIPLEEKHLTEGIRVLFRPVGEGLMNTVKAVVTDPQGNRSAEGSHRAMSDLRMPGDSNRDTNTTNADVNRGAPEVTITTGKNGRVTSPTLDNGKAVALVKLSADHGYSIGDTLVVTLPEGNPAQTIRLTAQHLNNGVRVLFNPAAEGQTNTVKAVVTDPQGNRSAEGQASAMSDLHMPGDSNRDTNTTNADVNRGAPEVTITTGKNGRVTSPTLDNGKAVALVKLSADHGYSIGDTLVVTLPEGNPAQTIRLTAQHLNNGVRVLFNPAAEGQTNTVKAVVTDPQGNRSAEGQASAMSDLHMPGDSNRDTNTTNADVNRGAPEVTITTGKNGRVTSPTLDNGKAVALVKLSADHGYSIGDTLVVTLPEGNPAQTIRLTAQHLNNGVRVLFNPAAEGQTNTVKAVVTDPQGNRSAEGQASAMSDLHMPGDSNRDTNTTNADVNRGAPLVKIDTGNDNALQTRDLSNNKAQVTITLPEANGYRVGDELVVTLPNSAPQTVRLTAQHLTNGYTTEFTPNAHGQANTVTAVVTDPQGNRSQTGSHQANSDFPPQDPSTLTEIDMLIPTNDIILRNISARFAGVRDRTGSGRAIEEHFEGAALTWGGREGINPPSSITLSALGEVNAKDVNTFFQLINLAHANNPGGSGSQFLTQTGLIMSFELEINGKRTQVTSRDFGDIFLLDTALGTGPTGDDFFAFKTTPQTIVVDGKSYTVKLENSAENARLHAENHRLMNESARAHLNSTRPGLVARAFANLSEQEKNDLIYIRSPEGENSTFTLGFKVTSTDPNAVKPAVLPNAHSGKVDDSTSAWQSLNSTLTVTETTSGRFELKKDNDLFGIFTGNRNGEFQFSPQSAMLLNIDNREELSASFRKGKHTVTLNLKGSYSTDVAKLAESDKVDVIYKITEGSVIDYNKIDSRVEMIDLTRSEVTLQNLTLANVKAHNDSGLYIKGDGRDIIHLGSVTESGSATQQDQSGVWRKGAVHHSSLDSETPVAYDTWTHTDNTVLYLQQGIQVL